MSRSREAYPGSPESETFSTPPSTPGPAEAGFVQPSLSRMPNKLASLHINHKPSDWTPDIELQISPDDTRKGGPNGVPTPSLLSRDYTAVPGQPNHLPPPPLSPTSKLPVNSPCFVHSHLDKGAHLTDFLKNKHPVENADVGVARSLQLPTTTTLSPESSGFLNGHGHGHGHGHGPGYIHAQNPSDDEDEFHGSLTKRLAETAVGVREMSKQLGRARVQSNIQNVLIITKARDNRLIKLTRQLALYLMLKHRKGSKRGLVVYVDSQLRNSRRFDAEGIQRDHPELFEPFPRRRTSSNHSISSLSSSSTHREESDEGQLRYWTNSMCRNSPHLFDFVVTLGGDGTVLHTSWLFQKIVPPVLSFALGSLGFLTNFDFADHQAVMDSAIDNGIRVNLRMRFTCTVYRSVANEEGKGRKAVKMGQTGEIMMKNIEQGGWEALEGGWTGGYAMGETSKKDKEIMCFTTRPVGTFEVLNDLVVDRGPSPYVSQLELFGDEHHMTTVQADGLTVSTPTGSTAYSLSAGGSLVHPEIPAILITPICPHTLSFRPMLLPDSMELRICVPYNSRATAYASFDGRGRIELKQGDHIKVTASMYPFPTVCADKQSTDWFHAISRTLKWNERERQKSFVVVEEAPPKRRREKSHADTEKKKAAIHASQETPEDEEEDEVSDDEPEAEEEEDDDKFDIDDAVDVDAAKAAKEALFIPDPSVLTKRRMKSRSRSRARVPHSGVNSPSRFASQTPQHSPGANSQLRQHHVDFDIPLSNPSSGPSSPDSLLSQEAEQGVRDDLHARHPQNGKSRIPKDRDLDFESVKTPTPAALHLAPRSRSRDPGHRAFAVWGQDDSDSNASDSESR